MQFAVTRTLLVSALLGTIVLAATSTSTSTSTTNTTTKQQQIQQQKAIAAPAKLKRDAGLSFGRGPYHGPSHKYLPPPAVSLGGYESTYGSLHGNGLGSGSGSGFDFASLDTDGDHHHQHQSYPHHHHHHHYSHQPQTHYQSLASHHGHGRPVYISSGDAAAHGGYQQQHQHHHHQQQHRPQKVETYIVQTAGGSLHGHQQQGHDIGGGGYKYAGHGGGSNFLSLLGGLGSGHKQHGSGGSSISSSNTYSIASPSYISSSHGPAIGLGHGLGHGQGHHGSIDSSHGLGLGSHHFVSALNHALEQEQVQVQQPTGYNYEAPVLHLKQPQPQQQQHQLLSSYGVPLLPGYEHDSAAEHHHQQQQQQQHHHHEVIEEQQPEHVQHKLNTEQQQPPAYALGHKGLGHFSYTSSKPLALNTDIHQIGRHEDHNELVAELSKAPFKPSAFLGAKHESSTGYDYATPTTTQYLHGTPTAQGYDYSAPSVLYGAPGQSGDSATPIFEAPDSTYLPPVSSYGPPATPTHSYH
ncbi:hornerin [Drosophila grimshawi]|uniref:GH12591 n=1 Tax=Drosophila grimshawi TaxID=7222 RepID=B4JK49_DROGR|nr:hornerin [Drosophila grimshawi]EDV99951.1 GH12591 [Drosophila grimshawi]